MNKAASDSLYYKPLNIKLMKKLLTLLMGLSFGLSTTLVHAQATQPAAHTNKSGTADKRYKENKKKEVYASSPEAVPAGPKKKDGSMDMRYKSNKGPNKTIVKHKGQ